MSAEETLRALSAQEAPHFAWASSPRVRRVVAALEAARPASARFVGGCVRDSIMGLAPKDVDVATTLKPDEVIAALESARLRYAPTGLAHGTVTAICERKPVEITTLRADVTTDGRRATVAFTDDWDVDARRRDFRLNAIYLTTDGRLYDPVGGVADAKTGRVRFIGDPHARIREDYLRILRFFRFTARFAETFDAQGLAACAAERAGLAILSRERVGDEMSKILALPRAAFAIEAMAKTGVLAAVWPAPADLDALAALKRLAPDAPAPLALAALWGEGGEGIDAALRLSNADARRRKTALAAARAVSLDMRERDARACLHRFGEAAFRAGALLAAARAGGGKEPSARLDALLAVAPPPPFPFTGKDVVRRGVAPGPDVAKVLRQTEEAWIAEDFPPRERLERILADKAAQARSDE
ncbi:MAG: CCA tRNA nucleotidyltransferase [Amphiplicatus sp.]